jgi:hypothetical protein
MERNAHIAPSDDIQNDWIATRIGQLHELMERNDYRGYDPFDLPNSPFFRFVRPTWQKPQLLISKFGSRVAPIALRKLLLVPRTEDPKIYACAYFGYSFMAGSSNAANARRMLEGIVRIGRRSEDGISWGYDFTWPTLSDGVNPRGASTIVPASFAMLALIHETVTTGTDEYLPALRDALRFYGNRHLRRNANGPFLGYFTHSTINTHNASLLGCAALSLGGRLLGDDRLLRVAAEAAATSLRAVDDSGYIRYNDGPSGDWTDSFHHLYVIAAISALALAHPSVDRRECDEVIGRMLRYYRETFLRADGEINYFPGTVYPVDSHNYAATAIFSIIFDDDFGKGRSFAADLLHKADELTWDDRHGYYIHRIHRKRRDRREFLRWNQAWMFLALAVVDNPEEVRRQLDLYNHILAHQDVQPS